MIDGGVGGCARAGGLVQASATNTVPIRFTSNRRKKREEIFRQGLSSPKSRRSIGKVVDLRRLQILPNSFQPSLRERAPNLGFLGFLLRRRKQDKIEQFPLTGQTEPDLSSDPIFHPM